MEHEVILMLAECACSVWPVLPHVRVNSCGYCGERAVINSLLGTETVPNYRS